MIYVSRGISGCDGVLWGEGVMSKLSGFCGCGPLKVVQVLPFIVLLRSVLLLRI